MYTTRNTFAKQANLIKINENVKFCTKALNAIKMSFKTYGERPNIKAHSPPLIMMHGLFGSKDIWRSVCKALNRNTKPQRQVIAVDVRNHGDSLHTKVHTYPHIAEDIKAFLVHQKISKAALLGHSMGGRAMMYFALNNSNLVDKLIVGDISPISASASFKSMGDIFHALQKVVLPVNVSKTAAKLSVDEQLLKILEDRSLCMFLITNLTQDRHGSYKWKPNIPVLLASFDEHLLKFPTVTNLKFTGPVLFITGKESDFVPKTDHNKILELFPKAEFKEMDGAGHWLYTDKPEEFNKICVEFLNRKS